MAQEVICQYCRNKVTKDAIEKVDNKNFHKKCASLYSDKKELVETICRIFKFKAPGPKNNAYISKFFNEGMTYQGMTKTLVYFYEIKKNTIDKSNGGIGIIPYVYEEARNYYMKQLELQKQNEQILENIKRGLEHLEVPETRKVRVQPRGERKPIVKPMPLINYFEE